MKHSTTTKLKQSRKRGIVLEKSDLKFLLPCFGILLGALLFLQDFLSVRLVASGERIGTLVMKKNIALRKQNAQVFWEDVSEQFPLYSLDTIRTGKDSAAFISLKDGTELDVEENTLVVINVSRQGGTINIGAGKLRARRSLKKALGSKIGKLAIESGEQRITLGDGDLQIDKSSKDAKLNVSVSRGEVELRTALGDVKSLQQNERLEVDSQGTFKIEAIPFELKEPLDGMRYATQTGSYTVRFRWEKKSEAKQGAVFLELSSDDRFRNIIQRKRISSSSLELALPPGDYYWRIGSAGKSEAHSYVFKFSIVASKALQLQSPQAKHKIVYVKESPFVHFAWSKHNLAESYVLEIARDAKFDELIEEKSSQNTFISMRMQAGQYYWRIKSKSLITGGGHRSRSRSLTVVQDIGRGLRIEISDPTRAPVWRGSLLEGVLLAWKDMIELKQASVQLSQNPQFNSLILEEKTRRNVYTLNKLLPVGTYYWRVVGVEPKTKPSPSGVLRIVNNTANALRLISPAKNKRLSFKAGYKQPVQFRWDAPEGLIYELTLARDADLKQIIKRIRSSKQSLQIRALRLGAYYWNVRLFAKAEDAGSDSPFLGQSEVFKLSIASAAIELSRPAPKTITSLFQIRKRGLQFAWTELKGGHLYRWLLAKDRRMRRIVMEREVEDESLKLDKLRSGTYYWKIELLHKESKALLGQSRLSQFSVFKTGQVYLNNGRLIETRSIKRKANTFIVQTLYGKEEVIQISDVKSLIY